MGEVRIKILSLFLLIVSTHCANPTVSIIGAGIGGSSCAYYLHKFAPNESNVFNTHVYDANDYIGGRINEITFGGQLEEIGADAWSPVNFYLQELQQDLGIELGSSNYTGNGELGIWDVTEFVSYVNIILRNLKVDLCVSEKMNEFISNLEVNYGTRQVMGPFSSVNDFLSYGDLSQYTIQEFNSFLQSNCNATQEYMDDLVAPIVRAIYDQPMNLTSFAGEVSLLAIFTPAKWVANGNSQIPKTLLQESGATVHLNTKIDVITWTGNGYQLTYNDSSISNTDFIVLAAPIEKMDITFSNVEFYSQIQSREYVHCYVTHVQATSFNPLYFGMEANQEIPDSVMTTPNSNLPFTIAQIRDPSLTQPGAKIYKIFSNTDISDQLDDIFIDVSDFNVKHWEYTFPELIPTSSYQPIELAKNMFYINTMESVATAMEVAVIGGRNIAQILLGVN